MNSVPGVMQLESKGGSSGTFSPAARAFSSSALIQNHQLVEETTADRVCVLCILRRAKPTLPLLVHFGSWGNAVNGHVYKLFGSRNIEQLVEVFEDSREHLLFPVKQYCHRRIECDGSRSEHEGKEKRDSYTTYKVGEISTGAKGFCSRFLFSRLLSPRGSFCGFRVVLFVRGFFSAVLCSRVFVCRWAIFVGSF